MLYEREIEASAPSTNVKLTLQASPGHSAMLDLLSKRFSIAKYSLMQPVIEKSIVDMFSTLHACEKFELALAADLIVGNGDVNETSWRDFAKKSFPDEYEIYISATKED